MRRIVHDEPPLSFEDVARRDWEHYVETKTDHHYDEPAKPGRKRKLTDRSPAQRDEDSLLLYMRTHGH